MNTRTGASLRPEETARIFAAVGAITAVAVAGLLVPVRDVLGATNVALVLAIVVAGAAMLGGSVAGVVTSLAAALSFDYFHTEPYFDLRIDKRDDVVTAVLLLVLGVAVGVFASVRHAMRLDAQVQARGAAHLEDVAAVVAAGANLDEAWPVVRRALLDQLDLQSCRFEPTPFEHHYTALGRDGHIESTVLHYEPGGFALPPEGAVVPVVAGGHSLGRLVLLPTPHRGTTRSQRRVVVALADQLAVAASRGGPLHALS
jgi:K+-sensing histidine kinase KdpD